MYVITGYQFNLSYDRLCRMSCFDNHYISLSNAERVGVRRCDIDLVHLPACGHRWCHGSGINGFGT